MENVTVAIELGSSKISGIAGLKQENGTLKVMSYADIDATSCIRHGAVYNLDKTANAIVEIITRLESQLNAKIDKAVIGYGCQSIRSAHSKVSRHFDEETVINTDITDRMLEECENQNVPDDYLRMLTETQEYEVNNQKATETDPIGIACNDLTCNYLSILLKSQAVEYFSKCFIMASIDVLDGYVTPIAEAGVLLTDEDKNQGCALVNYGAETTSVSVYHKGQLRYLRVLPFGSSLITRDLATVLQTDIKEAEHLKVTYGLCNNRGNHSEDEVIKIGDREVPLKEVGDIIEARNEEILKNVAHQIKASGLYNDLYSGIILTGGGANLRYLDESFKDVMPHLRMPRVVTEPLCGVEWVESTWRKNDGSQASLLSILSRCSVNCCEFNSNDDIDKITPAQEEHLTTPPLFNADGESAQIDRDREAAEKQKKRIIDNDNAKKDEENKSGSKKSKNNFSSLFDSIMKKSEDFFNNVQ